MRNSWIDAANHPANDFPLANLPYGVFSQPDRLPHCCVAIGDQVLDLAEAAEQGLLGEAASSYGFNEGALNTFMAQGQRAWDDIRQRLTELLSIDASPELHTSLAKAMFPLDAVRLHLPFKVAGYTDFYAGRQHAFNSGSILRGPENALTPNWPHMPIAYNGRASTVVVSGTPIRRPLGQYRVEGQDKPAFGPCRRLDLEVEFGTVIGLPTEHGSVLTIEEAEKHIFGYVLLNDWSARDIQRWEGQPLGPFQAKAFGTTISPWIVTKAALEGFRIPGPDRDVPLLPYLQERSENFLDVNIEAWHEAEGAVPSRFISTNTRYLYYSPQQLLTHHAVCGCRMETGDLLGSGTISGPERHQFGCLMEQSWGGRDKVSLDNGLERIFLEDGDSVRLSGWAQGDGYRIGFGSCEGKILPAPIWPTE